MTGALMLAFNPKSMNSFFSRGRCDSNLQFKAELAAQSAFVQY